MTKPNDGGPAFPGECGNDPKDLRRGMSLRDWFAGQALAGMLADHEMNATPEVYAEWAHKVADAMLAERAKGGAE